jgi:hypothetical protein
LLASPTEATGISVSNIHSISQSVLIKKNKTATEPALPLPMIVSFFIKSPLLFIVLEKSYCSFVK